MVSSPGAREAALAQAAAPTAALAEAFAEPAAADTADEGARERQPPGPSAAQRALTPLDKLQMRLHRNARYHEDRQGFFDVVTRWANFFVVVAGSTAASTALSSSPRIAAWAGGVAAVMGAGQLVFDFAGRARTHLELRKAFLALASKATQAHPDVQGIEAQMVEAYGGEPEVYHAVNALAYNATQKAYDRGDSTLMKIAPWRRILRHVWRFDPSDFPDASPI